jgi:hypothetical protein
MLASAAGVEAPRGERGGKVRHPGEEIADRDLGIDRRRRAHGETIRPGGVPCYDAGHTTV